MFNNFNNTNTNTIRLINPEISKYIKEQNRWIKKYSVDVDLAKHPVDLHNYYAIIPFVSLLFFLAGYNFSNLIRK
jgi:hypothetical protein